MIVLFWLFKPWQRQQTPWSLALSSSPSPSPSRCLNSRPLLLSIRLVLPMRNSPGRPFLKSLSYDIPGCTYHVSRLLLPSPPPRALWKTMRLAKLRWYQPPPSMRVPLSSTKSLNSRPSALLFTAVWSLH